MSETILLQAMRLKGRLTAEQAAVCAALPIEDAKSALADFERIGWAQQVGQAMRLAPLGRERLDELIRAERAELDAFRLESYYRDFDLFNTEFKQLITAWQMKDPETPNDHTDEVYDRRIVKLLLDLDTRFDTLLGAITGVVPRLRPYRLRFSHAAEQVRNGDMAFIARPIADSYHTVWFELHEELIALLGLSRLEEAAAGRAV